MSLRIGLWVFTPQTVFLPLAFAFFWMLGKQAFLAIPMCGRIGPRVVLFSAVLGGFVGGLAHGMLMTPDNTDLLHSVIDLRFGSLGGYWGALFGASLCAARGRYRILVVADALVPGILAGGAVARIGCIFTGCCRGIPWAPAALGGFQPFRLWPVYDLASLLIVLALVKTRPSNRPGVALAWFLCLYGTLRFLIEFARNGEPLVGPVGGNQCIAAVQVAAGSALVLSLVLRNARK